MSHTTSRPLHSPTFFLGGHDLEMQAITELLHSVGVEFHDAHLHWGAQASAYADAIDAALAQGHTPVLVELQDDVGALARGAVLVDHHGERASQHQPSSLRQVFDLLAQPASAWTRTQTLIAANDCGGLDGLLAAGATPDEARHIKHADYAAQGMPRAELAQAQQAARQAQHLLDGRLCLTQSTNNRSLAVADALHPLLGGPGCPNVLVQCPDELAFMGEGTLVQCLAQALPGGWWGGQLPQRGFWGHPDPSLEPQARHLLMQAIQNRPPA